MDLSPVYSRISQRYFLVVMCFFGFLFTSMNSFLFELVLKEMFYSAKERSFTPPCLEKEDGEAHSVGKEEFQWRSTIKDQVIIGWIYGKLLGQIPLALLTDKFGAKTIFGFSIFVPGICSAITPISARSSPYIVISVRVLIGFFASTQFVTQAWMAARWFPHRARGLMLSIVYMGYPLGLCLGLWLNHFNAHSMNMTWSSICYINGCLAVLFAYFWQLLIWDDPFEHPYITDNELVLLATQVPMYTDESELKPGWSWPWKSMVQSRCLWLLSIALIGDGCITFFAEYFIFLVYFPDVQVYDLTKHETAGSVLGLALAAGMMLGGATGDWVVTARQWISMTQLAKTYFTCKCILSPLILIAVTQSNCNLYLATFSFMAVMFCLGFSITNWTVVCLHLAPNFVSTTMAFTALPNIILSPALFSLNSYIINRPTNSNWVAAGYLNAVICVFTTAVFLKWGKVEPQLWNEPQKTRNKHDDASGSFSNNPSADLSSKNHNMNNLLMEDNLNDEPGDKRRVAEKTSKYSRSSKSKSDIINRKGKTGPLSDHNEPKDVNMSTSKMFFL